MFCCGQRHRRPLGGGVGFDDPQRLPNVPSFGRLLMSALLTPGDLPERDGSPPRGLARYLTS